MRTDTIVEEVRRVREAHAVKFNYDLVALYRALKIQEQQSGRSVVTLSPKHPVLVPKRKTPKSVAA